MTPFPLWQKERLAALTAPDGWLNLTDRVEVGPAPQTVGSGPDNALVLSVGPARLGVLRVASPADATLTRDGVTHAFQPHPGAGPRLQIAGLLLEIHTVEDVPALRVRDLSRKVDPHLRYFPHDPRWIIPAAWARLPEPRRAGIDMVGGRAEVVIITHVARFSHDGHQITLLPTHQKAGQPMFVIRDATSGIETYAASRFLIAEPQGDSIVLDFNRAHTPPCGFTDFAICPLPPPENRLPFAVRAGELAP